MSKTLLLNADASPVSYLPITTISWKDAINKIYDGTVSILAEYSDWEVSSPSTTVKIPSVVMLNSFVKYQRYVQFNRPNVFLRDNYTCQYCGHHDPSGHDLSLDHVIPRFHGGKTNFTNIVTACYSCNSEKSHYMKMSPKVLPKKPTYHELVNRVKQYDITIPCEDWIPFLDWGVGKITILNQ